MAMIVFSEDGNYYITLIEMHIKLLPNICNPQQFENIISHANDVYCTVIAFIYAHEFSRAIILSIHNTANAFSFNK